MSVPPTIAAGLTLLLCQAIAGRPAQAQNPPQVQPGCRADRLVPWNCAEAFTGLVGWKSVKRGDIGDGGRFLETQDVTVTITAGRADCLGTLHGSRSKPGDYEGSTDATLGGSGLVAVEFGIGTDDDPSQAYYRITVACPGFKGVERTRDIRSGTTDERQFDSEPADFSNPLIETYKQPGTERATTLKGTVSSEHPETDPANGITGTITVTWSLTRILPVR